MKVNKVPLLQTSQHFTMGKTAGDRWQVMAADANDDVAARAIEIVAKENQGDLTATNEQSAKMLIWELDEQYERAWHSAAWRRYSGNPMTKQMDLPMPIRKANRK